MANQIYDYLIPSEYTYDSAKIEIVGGIAKLKNHAEFTNLVGYWKFEDDYQDSSGQAHYGTAVGTPSFTTGKVDRCISLGGHGDYISIGTAVDFDFGATIDFSMGGWIKSTIDISAINRQILGKKDSFRLETINGKLQTVLGVGGGAYRVMADSAITWLNTWHFVVFTVDRDTIGRLYIDGSEVASTETNVGNRTNDINSNKGLRIGMDEGEGNGLSWEGLIDELFIYNNRILSLTEIQSIYNSGAGRHIFAYITNKPTIEPTNLLFPSEGVVSWDSFLETLGVGHTGLIGYNLYKTNKVNKYYWNGSAWVTGGSSSNYNTAATINSNIGTFDSNLGKIGFVAYLISDGTQIVELDENQITYTLTAIPLVNAGSDKGVKDNQSISPFSDCSFSDPDGNVIKAEYKVDGEVDTWTEIPQGGYGTLLEAVQAWTYQFNNLGTLTVRLQVTDDSSGGGVTSEDSLLVTVSKYTKTVNIRDSVTGEHLLGVLFDSGDGTTPIYQTSPFNYSWEYNSFNIEMTLSGYYGKAQTISVIDESDLNLTMAIKSVVNRGQVSVGLIGDSDTLTINAWLEVDGQTAQNPTSCQVELHDNEDVTQYSSSLNTNPDAEGVFHFSKTPSNLPDDQVYYAKVTIVNLGTTYTSVVTVGQINKTNNKRIKRILGLSQENMRIFNPQYDRNNNLISGTIKIYSNASDVDTDTNAIAEYEISANFNLRTNLMTSYKVKKI